MKHMPVLILALILALGLVTPGCRETHVSDARLTAADSLIGSQPDSALAMLEAMGPADLPDEADRAYRGLLITQARYKCYITATSDSDINRALTYYRKHKGEREKLTRAYIYKGAVMKELGYPDSAMTFFKAAEETAAPTDYKNLGYIKLQMGALYNENFSIDGQEKVKYEEALEYFRKANDSVYILLCLNNLGCMYRASNPAKAESMLLEASRLARQLHDTTKLAYNDLSLMVHYFYQGRYEEARRVFWELSGFNNHKADYTEYFNAAYVYARLGILDSAEMYHHLACQNRAGDEAVYRTYYLQSLSELALARKDTVNSHRLNSESLRIEDSLLENSEKFNILQVEVSHDNKSMEKKQRRHRSTVYSYRWLIGLLLAVSALILFWGYRRAQRKAHRYDGIIADLKDEIANQSVDIDALKDNINTLKIKDEELKVFIDSHNDMMREVMEECYHMPQGPLAKGIRKIIKYQDENSGIWSKLYTYLDMEYHHIMSETRKNYPQLGEKDLLMIALTCMGYSCAQIAIVLDYSSSSGISTVRKRVAAKMGLDGSLTDYVRQFKPEE